RSLKLGPAVINASKLDPIRVRRIFSPECATDFFHIDLTRIRREGRNNCRPGVQLLKDRDQLGYCHALIMLCNGHSDPIVQNRSELLPCKSPGLENGLRPCAFWFCSVGWLLAASHHHSRVRT